MSAFFDHDRQAEARAQSALLDRLSEAVQGQLEDALTAATLAMLDFYEATGNVPPVDEALLQAIADAYAEMGTASIRAFGARIVNRGKALGKLEVKDDAFSFAEFFQRLAQEWIAQEAIRRRIVSVAETTRRIIVNAVDRGQDEGEGVDAIAQRIRDVVPTISRQRAALIARTETHGAANFGANETAKASGLVLVKEWVATEDARTRAISRDDAFDHLSMDGQVRDMDQPFEMPWAGGDDIRIMYPGQAGLPGGATINCRCSIVHDVKDD